MANVLVMNLKPIIMRIKYKKKRGPVTSKKISQDGIEFSSGLERYMYNALKKAKVQAVYEGQTYEIFSGFDFPNKAYERCGNGKGNYKDRGSKKILNIKYTPDFIGKGFIIETKGRANESFPLRWKMFKRYVVQHLPGVTLYKPQNHKECDTTVKLILELKNK